MVVNAMGIQNIWESSYTRSDGSVLKGASLRGCIPGKNAKLAGEIQSPFDQEIVSKDSTVDLGVLGPVARSETAVRCFHLATGLGVVKL